MTLPHARAGSGRPDALSVLARELGVQVEYRDGLGQRRRAGEEALVRVLKALGAELDDASDAPRALAALHLERAQRGLEPVVLAWEGTGASVPLTPPGTARRLSATLVTEDGGEVRWDTEVEGALEVEGVRFCRAQLRLPADAPLGYHRLRVEGGGWHREARVVVAPAQAHPASRRRRGIFVPLYALYSRRSRGSGTFSDLRRLGEWAAHHGVNLVGTLPLLSAFLDEPSEPSPYSPVSRRFWNELFLDLDVIPEVRVSERARRALGRHAAAFDALRASPLVDHPRQATLQRDVLTQALADLDSRPSARRTAFHGFLRSRPEVEQYARFRAAGEVHGADWRQWPASMQRAPLAHHGVDADRVRYHLYVQWLCAEQVALLVEGLHGAGSGLYLDVPVGGHRFGYDVWKDQDVFPDGVSLGAPPDGFFEGGQDWALAPLNPHASRAQGHETFRALLAHQMATADVLRVDHVMALHRTFWVPEGMDPTDGVYVQAPGDELWGVLCLESHRHGCRVVGEDLGTVPAEVRKAMRRLDVGRSWVAQFEVDGGAWPPLREPPRSCVATLDTHDTPTFAAWWNGLDAETADAVTSWLADEGHDVRPGAEGVLAALLRHLSQSHAETVMVALEDLWLETRPQNVPGTGPEAGNWRRKARYDVETLTAHPAVREVLEAMARGRTTP